MTAPRRLPIPRQVPRNQIDESQVRVVFPRMDAERWIQKQVSAPHAAQRSHIGVAGDVSGGRERGGFKAMDWWGPVWYYCTRTRTHLRFEYSWPMRQLTSRISLGAGVNLVCTYKSMAKLPTRK
jgi:hypothetical protein